MGYTKLFSSIVASTIWREDDKTRLLWITMLAMADKNGEVQASVPGLADFARVTIKEARDALGKLMSPDEDSRTKTDGGRRIEEIDGGWLIINHAKYRHMASKDESKSAAAVRQKRYRERQKRNGVGNSNASVTQDRDIAEADSETEDTKRDAPKPRLRHDPSGVHPQDEPYFKPGKE